MPNAAYAVQSFAKSYSARIVPHVSSSIEFVQGCAKFELADGTGGRAVVPEASWIVLLP